MRTTLKQTNSCGSLMNLPHQQVLSHGTWSVFLALFSAVCQPLRTNRHPQQTVHSLFTLSIYIILNQSGISSVPSETVRVHIRMPDQGTREDNEIVYKHVNRQYKSSFILPELACSISTELLRIPSTND